jgi:hypothetical protein
MTWFHCEVLQAGNSGQTNSADRWSRMKIYRKLAQYQIEDLSFAKNMSARMSL